MFMMIMSLIPLTFSFILLYNSTFISIEMPLISLYSINIPISFMIDWTSLMFLFTVMFISSMILLFSMEYIPYLEHKQFSLMLLLFVISMSFLILSDNIIFIILGWDGLGLTSFALVVYYQNSSSSASGSITIFSNRVGDILILLSIAFLMSISNWNFIMNEKFPMLILLFLMMAACTKSAQFPFSAWLPAAMAAPTPISALVHSSTLVTAGVYILIRIMNYPHPITMITIMIISSMTAIYASMSANWEMDMKKIIALSTLSQIAMMMFAISLGSISLAFFHLIIHALFKSMMFLCAGIMIHSSTYQDMRNMGTVLNSTPMVNSILGIASFSLMGFPFMSGFFSKDPILGNTIFSNTLLFMTILMIMSVSLTSTYSFRMISLALKFSLKSKPDINMYPSNFMEIPIMIMAPFSIIMGTSLMWIMYPEQLLIIPNQYKFLIIISLLTGIILGMIMLYSSQKYLSFGQASTSLWFNHFLTTIYFMPLSFLMKMFLKNDKLWQETYGPKYCFNYYSKLSYNSDMIMSQLMFIIMMMMMYPILILSI
uniref:NADH-ubiquinone oxidoreductase chain 5 n=1 Tax=Neoscona nautica TaxID=258338 RepID=A0A140AU46_9ARAC|nr:NADH dehydrogenase subunit 5 [Neoscona nautica]ALF63153.1 NADH dehydrogenase subunit 5 [Neoscona nautica]